MQKIATDTATAQGNFRPSAPGQTPTQFSAAWCNAVQDELVGIATMLGDSLDSSNNGQCKDAVEKVAVKTVVVNLTTYTVPSGWKGGLIIFCTAASLTISGNIANGAPVVVIPDGAQADFTLTYGSSNITITKGGILFGRCINSGANNYLRWLLLPMFSASVPLQVSGIKAGKYFDEIVEFEHDGEGGQLEWQKATYWEVGQVKKVICTNAGTPEYLEYGHPTVSYGNGVFRIVGFYPHAYREFVCTGTTVIGGVSYAILMVNGKDQLD